MMGTGGPNRVREKLDSAEELRGGRMSEDHLEASLISDQLTPHAEQKLNRIFNTQMLSTCSELP